MMSPMEPHLEKARLATAGYAPAPEASALIYGMNRPGFAGGHLV